MSLFYDNLIDLKELDAELEELALEYHEKSHLLEMADSALHHAVMETILDELPKQRHSEFLRNFAISPQDPAHIDFLLVYSPDIVEKIKTKAKKTTERFRQEVKRHKARKEKK